MASPVGLAIRNEKAQVRINDSLDLLADLLGIEVPESPARSRDPFLREMLRMEWTAETLEVLATASIGRIEPLPEVEAEEQSENSDEPAENQDLASPQEQGPEQSEISATDGNSDPGPSDGPDEPDDVDDAEPLDPVELKKLKLDALKELASERGIANVQDVRSKDEVIEKLIEGTE